MSPFSPPYWCALKSLAYIGIFSIWPLDTSSLRVPMLLAGVATVYLFFIFFRMIMGSLAALIADQESLVSLDQLRSRMPDLRKQDQAVQAELQSLETAAGDQTKYLRLVETLADFRARLRARADTLDVPEQQKVLRLLVKEVLVGRETITIRHSILVPTSGPDPSGVPRPPQETQQPPTPQPGPCYLLRSGRAISAAGQHLSGCARYGTGAERAPLLPIRG